MRPLVSILIPCYNAAPWLEQTLASALAQTWDNLEVILVDDGSRDESLSIARRFASSRVRVFAQPNRGAAAARNHALREARGDLFQFLDADDLLTPDKVAAQIDLLAGAAPGDLPISRWGRFHDNPMDVTYGDDDLFRDFTPVEFLLLHTAEARMMHPAAWLVPRAIAERAGPWDERLTLNDDGEYFARVALAARRLVAAPAGASLYRTGLPGSLSRRRDARALASLALSTELIAGHLLRAENSPRVCRALADYWQRLIYELYPDAPELRARAAAEVRTLGGSRLRPAMGGRERAVSLLIGWKLARRLSGFLQKNAR